MLTPAQGPAPPGFGTDAERQLSLSPPRRCTVRSGSTCDCRPSSINAANTRTALDLGRRYGRTLAVIRIDALIQATDLSLVDVETLIQRHRAARGIVQLREVVALADGGAESPQESRTRLVLTDAGLRPRKTQIDVYGRFGDHVGRIDMGWPEWKGRGTLDEPGHSGARRRSPG
jgi:hypothetical protein